MPRDARTDASETREPPCPHPPDAIHWHPAKEVQGVADGSSPDGHHLAQGGICRRCRWPMLRLADVAPWGPAEPVARAEPQPAHNDGRQWTHRRRYG